jgi:hypothetical protein
MGSKVQQHYGLIIEVTDDRAVETTLSGRVLHPGDLFLGWPLQSGRAGRDGRLATHDAAGPAGAS